MPVDAPPEVAWQFLCDSVEFPQHFAAGVESVSIFERDGNCWLREVRRFGRVQRERVTIDELTHTITAELLDHAFYTGRIVSRLEIPGASASQREPRLSFRMDWTPRAGEEDPLEAAAQSATLEQDLLTVKRAAEARALLVAA